MDKSSFPSPTHFLYISKISGPKLDFGYSVLFGGKILFLRNPLIIFSLDNPLFHTSSLAINPANSALDNH